MDQNALMNDDLEFWGWLAGFWEGEGYLRFAANTHPKARFFEFGVVQTDPRPLQYIQDKLKLGNISVKRNETNKDGLHRKPLYMWRLTSAISGLPVLEMMRPHVRFRGNQIDRIIAEMKAHKWTHKPWTEEELRVLMTSGLSRKDLATYLKRTPSAVKQQKRLQRKEEIVRPPTSS